jgi:hypothetical protein
MLRARSRLVIPSPRRLAVLTPFVVALAALILPSVSSARVIAHRTISQAHGGIVRADGAELYVPPGALNEPHAVATISELRLYRFDFAIRGDWNGRVRITLPAPPAGWEPVVLHTVRGVTKVESRKLGQMTVWVNHLSVGYSGVPDACTDVLFDAEVGGPEAAAGGYAVCLAAYSITSLTATGFRSSRISSVAVAAAPRRLALPPSGLAETCRSAKAPRSRSRAARPTSRVGLPRSPPRRLRQNPLLRRPPNPPPNHRRRWEPRRAS